MFELTSRRLASVLLCALLAGCGDSGDATTTSDPTGAPTTTPSTNESTGEPTTGGPVTSEATGSTGGPGTTGPTTDTTAAGTTGPDTGETGTETGTSDDTGEETGGLLPCTKDEECALVDDCCACEPIGPGEAPPACDVTECLVNTCTTLGLEGAPLRCRFGRCTFVKIDCNPLQVTCKSLPPECPKGQVPSVDVEASCWTGVCAPAEACDWVPDCGACDEDELVCVQKLQKGAFEVCEPKPVDCGDVADIDCGCGQQICDASPPHTVCGDVQGGIACECPFC
jgi:hypothetical protein